MEFTHSNKISQKSIHTFHSTEVISCEPARIPPLQGSIIDLGHIGTFPAIRASFILPFISFLVVALYGYRSYLYERRGDITA